MKMNLVLIVFFVLIQSCAHKKPIEQQSRPELVTTIMNESQLKGTLNVLTGSSNCLRSFGKNLPKPFLDKILVVWSESFQSEVIAQEIQNDVLEKYSADEVLTLAKLLSSPIWTKFIGAQFYPQSPEGKQKVRRVLNDIDEKKLDLGSARSKNLAKILESDFTINIMNITSKVAQRGIASQSKHKQQMAKTEFAVLSHNIIRDAFAEIYVATEDFTENEVQQVLKVKTNPIMVTMKKVFEEKYGKAYEDFIKRLSDMSQTKNKT